MGLDRHRILSGNEVREIGRWLAEPTHTQSDSRIAIRCLETRAEASGHATGIAVGLAALSLALLAIYTTDARVPNWMLVFVVVTTGLLLALAAFLIWLDLRLRDLLVRSVIALEEAVQRDETVAYSPRCWLERLWTRPMDGHSL